MKSIRLRKGVKTIIDDEDYKFLKKWKWRVFNSRGIPYAMRSESHTDNRNRIRNNIYMHRLIMNCPQGYVVDHINHNGLDNRKENLRVVTRRENQQNRKDGRKLTGVCKCGKKFISCVKINNKSYSLGVFTTEEEAHSIYMRASKALIEKEKQSIINRIPA